MESALRSDFEWYKGQQERERERDAMVERATRVLLCDPSTYWLMRSVHA